MGNFISSDKGWGEGHLKYDFLPFTPRVEVSHKKSKFTEKGRDKKCRCCETFIRADYKAVCRLEFEMTFWHKTDIPQADLKLPEKS